MGCRTRVPVRTSMLFILRARSIYEPDENAVSHRLACEYCMFVMACLSYASFLFPLPVTTSAHKHAAPTEGLLAPCYPVDCCFRWLLGAVSETTRLLLLHRFGAWAPWLDCVYARSVGQRLSLSPQLIDDIFCTHSEIRTWLPFCAKEDNITNVPSLVTFLLLSQMIVFCASEILERETRLTRIVTSCSIQCAHWHTLLGTGQCRFAQVGKTFPSLLRDRCGQCTCGNRASLRSRMPT